MRALKIKPAHMTKLVARLVDRGLAQRAVPDDDRRSVRLSLTGAGNDFAARCRDQVLHLQITERSDLTSDEAATLIHLLRRSAGLAGDCPCL